MYSTSSPQRQQRGAGAGGGMMEDPQAAAYYHQQQQAYGQQPGVYYQGANAPVYVYDQQPAAAVPAGYAGGAGKPPGPGGMGVGGDDWDMEAAQQVATESAYIEKAEAAMRVSFMRKVYGILLLQLLATIGMATLFMFEPSANEFVLSSPRLLIAGLVLSFVTLIALICVRHKHPANMILLSIFTLIEAYTLGVVCASLQRGGAGELVFQAFIITAAILVGLTAFTLFSKIDFSWLGAVCFAGLLGLLAWGLIIWIMGWRQSFIYSLIGAILFSLLLIYDTYMISKRLSPDEYILGAISLYMDTINIFLFVLQLLGAGRRD